MAETFSNQLCSEAWPIWLRIFQHPFLTEIKEGVLPLRKFRYYIIQDYIYLEGFSRAVALALAKAPDSVTLEKLSKRITTPIERPLHRKLMPLLGLSEETLREYKPSPTNLAYINHLIRTASLGSLGTTAGALLPCPWTYHLLGGVIGHVDHEIYGTWSSAYVDGLLEGSVNAWRSLIDSKSLNASQEELDAIKEAFMTSSRYEFLFWEMAYTEESWTI